MTLEEEKRHFFSVVGKALDEWAQVETHLCSIFSVCLRAPTDRARASFYAVENFSSKLQMVDGVIAMAVSDYGTLSDWANLLDKINIKYKLRNDLVHYNIIEDKTQRQGFRITLCPAILNQKAPSLFRTFGLRLRELKTRQELFHELGDDLAIFYAGLCRTLGSPRA
jgi:hypothetical protein